MARMACGPGQQAPARAVQTRRNGSDLAGGATGRPAAGTCAL
jgi:hypothetical protein